MLHPLQILRDRITDSTVNEVGFFISETDLALLKLYIPEIISFIPKINRLSIIPWTTLNLLDYDETIQQRHYQLQIWLLQDNRGLEGNRVIDEVIWREKFLEKYYRKSSIVWRIAMILSMQDMYHQARIVTAGETSWQKNKIQTTWIYDSKNGVHVVSDARYKILSILKEIFKLWYIPAKIIIYDDRPEHFKKIAEALSKFLWGVEIVVNHVVLSQQEVVKRQIADIHQTIYTPKSL